MEFINFKEYPRLRNLGENSIVSGNAGAPVAPMTPRRTPSVYSYHDFTPPVNFEVPTPSPRWRPATKQLQSEVEEHTYVEFGASEIIQVRNEVRYKPKKDNIYCDEAHVKLRTDNMTSPIGNLESVLRYVS